MAPNIQRERFLFFLIGILFSGTTPLIILYGYLESLWLNDVLRKSHECEQKSLEPQILDSALGTPEHACALRVLLAMNIY